MNRHDPAAQVAIRDLPIAYIEEHLLQPFLVREVPNGGREIFIDAGRVMRHLRADPRQQPERIPIVQGPKPTEDWPGKLQAHKPTAWLQNSVNVRECLPKIADVSHAKPCGHGMERPIRKSQMFGVGFETGNLLPQTPPGDFLEPLNQHRVVQVGGNDAAIVPHARFDQKRQIGCAGADIERPASSRDGDIGGGNFLPPVMQPEAQERVVEVIDASNRRKHPLNGLLAGRASPSRDSDRSRWRRG
mgnify:CR=1 FL=1